MRKKTIKDIDIVGKRVLVRVDYNVPLDQDGKVLNDSRIRATIPTIEYLIERNAKIILVTHVGRPKGEVVERLRTTDIARVLSELIKRPVKKLDDCIGKVVEDAISEMKERDIILLENVRFYPEEKKNDVGFAQKLASYADIFVNDGFGVSHRDQSSVTGVTAFLPSVSGLLVAHEIEVLTSVRDNPKKPLVVVMGGVKLETRIPMIEQFVEKADVLLFGGAMIFTFFKAMGKEVGKSVVDDEFLNVAKELMDKYSDKLVFPVDVVVASALESGVKTDVVEVDAIPSDKIGLDIGPHSVSLFANRCTGAATIIWNGPLGAFETAPFDAGTRGFAEAIITMEAYTVIGGGDTASALEGFGLGEKMDFVSTGGGASLTLLEGKTLPGIEALENCEN